MSRPPRAPRRRPPVTSTGRFDAFFAGELCTIASSQAGRPARGRSVQGHPGRIRPRRVRHRPQGPGRQAHARADGPLRPARGPRGVHARHPGRPGRARSRARAGAGRYREFAAASQLRLTPSGVPVRLAVAPTGRSACRSCSSGARGGKRSTGTPQWASCGPGCGMARDGAQHHQRRALVLVRLLLARPHGRGLPSVALARLTTGAASGPPLMARFPLRAQACLAGNGTQSPHGDAHPQRLQRSRGQAAPRRVRSVRGGV